MDDEKSLESQIDEAEWSWLIPHLERGALILVAGGNRLVDVAQAVAADHKQRVDAWIQSGVLKKPTLEQTEIWKRTPTKKFLCVVVQPYVLAQEILLN